MHLFAGYFPRVMAIWVTHGECAIQRVIQYMPRQIVGTLLAYLKDDIRMALAKHAEDAAQMWRKCITVIPKPQSVSGLFRRNIRHRARNFRKNLTRSNEKAQSLLRQDKTTTASSLKKRATELLLHLSHLLP